MANPEVVGPIPRPPGQRDREKTEVEKIFGAATRFCGDAALMIEAVERLDARIRQLLGSNELLRKIKQRDKTDFEARIAELEAEVKRLELLAASQASENIDLNDRIFPLNAEIVRLNIEAVDCIRDFVEQEARLNAARDEVSSLSEQLAEHSLRLLSVSHENDGLRETIEAKNRLLSELDAQMDALQVEMTQLHAGREELAQRVQLRLAQLEVDKLILRLTLEHMNRRLPMSNPDTHSAPEDEKKSSGFGNEFMTCTAVVLVGLIVAFLLDKYTSSGWWVALEIIVALVAVIVTGISRHGAYQGSTLIVGGGPKRTLTVESPSEGDLDPAKVLADAVETKTAADEALRDFLPGFCATREAHRLKADAHAAAKQAWVDALDANKPPAEIQLLKDAKDAALAEEAAARATLDPVQTRHAELGENVRLASEAVTAARANLPKKPVFKWSIAPNTTLVWVMLSGLFVLFFTSIDGNRALRDSIQPRGYNVTWLTSDGAPLTKRIVVTDLPGKCEFENGGRIVEDGAGNYILTNVLRRSDKKPIQPRVDEVISPR